MAVNNTDTWTHTRLYLIFGKFGTVQRILHYNISL